VLSKFCPEGTGKEAYKNDDGVLYWRNVALDPSRENITGMYHRYCLIAYAFLAQTSRLLAAALLNQFTPVFNQSSIPDVLKNVANVWVDDLWRQPVDGALQSIVELLKGVIAKHLPNVVRQDTYPDLFAQVK
jgi:hypothetical protein